MGLRDHFHPPLSNYRHWQGFHSAWGGELVRQLNDELLPSRYFAEPRIKLGQNVEVDVATFEEPLTHTSDAGTLATQVWAPPKASLTAPLDFSGLDTFEVQVMSDEGGPLLVAAIELVSPGNKDRSDTRHALTMKCASYLQQGVSVMLVDVVTSRSGNLFDDLLSELRLTQVRAWQATPRLYAVSCRAVASLEDSRLEAWPERLDLGVELPTLPLWIGPDLALPVDLQSTYAAACSMLRLPAD